MFPRTILAFALAAVSAEAAIAAPPACLLAAVGTEPNPADLQAICGPDASKVKAQIKNLCGGSAATAMSAFSSICSSAGHNIATAQAVATTTKLSPAVEPAKATITQGTSTLSQMAAQPTTLLIATGGPVPAGSNSTMTIGSMTGPGVITPTAPGASGTGSPGYKNAAGRVDAEGFAALALVAAGLSIFL